MPFAWAKICHCAKAPSGGGRAELLAFEVLRLADAAALAPDDREGRLVVDHEHGLDRRARIGVAELDQRVDVAEAHVVGARRDAVDRLERAAGGVDGDVEALGLEVALVDRDQERRRRALELAVEREFDRGLRARPRWRQAPMRRREADPAEPDEIEAIIRMSFLLGHASAACPHPQGAAVALRYSTRAQQRTCRPKEQAQDRQARVNACTEARQRAASAGCAAARPSGVRVLTRIECIESPSGGRR